MEYIIFIATIIGGVAGIYAILDHRKKNIQEPKEELEHLIIQFKATQRQSRKLVERLKTFAIQHDAWDMDFMPMLTFRTCIVGLEDSLNGNLSDDRLTDMHDLTLTSPNIQSMVRSLETQFNSLLELEGRLKILQINNRLY